MARSATATAGAADLTSNPIRLAKRRITDLLACERYVVEVAAATAVYSSTCSPSTTC